MGKKNAFFEWKPFEFNLTSLLVGPILLVCSRFTRAPKVWVEWQADSSWADVKPSRKSTSHYTHNALVHWWSQVASILATSTTEAEVVSAARCFQDVAFCRKRANELGFMSSKSTVLLEDNNGCLSLVRTGDYRGRSKHFALRFQFIYDYMAEVFWTCVMWIPRTNWRTLESNPAHGLSFSEWDLDCILGEAQLVSADS